jgi:CRP-like cAMP-binding protein
VIIIAKGVVDLEVTLDSGTILTIEHLGRGSVINPMIFLVKDTINCVARVQTTSALYVLDLERFNETVCSYPEFKNSTLAPFINKYLYNNEGNNSSLDYIKPTMTIENKGKTYDYQKT